jgi:multidrug efflux pump subunit AcrB
MSHGQSDAEMVRGTHNTARFFTETRQISWVLLFGTVIWGVLGYVAMPQRKDPDIPVRDAIAICPWPGASAQKIEQLVTRRIEEKIAENSKIERVTSNSRTGATVVAIRLQKGLADVGKQFDDIKLKLDSIRDLPEGAGPINFVKDFGDTATLLLTVASPRIGEVELELRARMVREALGRTRLPGARGPRVAIVYGFPQSLAPAVVRPAFELFGRYAERQGVYQDLVFFEGPGFVGLDGVCTWDDQRLLAFGHQFIVDRLKASELHPDMWQALTIRDPSETLAKVAAAAGDKYSYRELKDYTDLVKRTLQTVPIVAKVQVSGVLPERVYLNYSQERLASYGIRPSVLPELLGARNITVPGGQIEIGDKNLRIDPSGEFRSEREIGDVLVPVAGHGALYLRDIVEVTRSYESPARFLNFFTHQDATGRWQRTRAVTLSVQMRAGAQIETFGTAVDAALEDLKQRLPEDLIMARTSNQPLQVEENIHLFMNSLYEAVFLVVVVSLIGFWEWRSALLMALSIPITLALTFGMMYTLGIDLQQVSIASLIIALGLLVDDPVVAGDAIKRSLADGHPPLVAAWLGPTKLATAILYATITNIVAYLPFLMLSGETGKFMYSLPVVITCSLVASRLVSMTFIPLLGYYLLRPQAEPTIAERRQRGFASWYYKIGSWSIAHRWRVLAASMVFLLLGVAVMTRLKTQFFPKDSSYLSYVDVWLPEDAPLMATSRAAVAAEGVIRQVAEAYGREHHAKDGKPRPVLESLTAFVGGGGPRFWMSVTPEQSQVNYAQILIQMRDKHDTQPLIGRLQEALSAQVVGANVDVRQLETGAPVGIPVSLRISGEDIPTLRRLSAQAQELLRSHPKARRVRDDWGAESFVVRLKIDPDKANLAGVTNRDVAAASATGMNGFKVATLREGEEQIPVVARMRMEERAQVGDVQNLYVYSATSAQKVPLELVSSVDYGLETERLQRRNQFRTVTVSAFPEEGALSSEVLRPLMPKIKAFERTLPPGYKLEIGGEYEKQKEGFGELAMVMVVSIVLIFLALVIQFKHALKPLLVFAAIPYGLVGAVTALWIMGAPFGFMAFLGVASLVGVIVSHVIVLFDFIEERHAEGAPLVDALLEAGIMRLRPVLITVGATVIALLPLASHGGPLWEPLCYAQIGGLIVATAITLLLVPVLYAIFVLDLGLVRWESASASAHPVTDSGATARLAPSNL